MRPITVGHFVLAILLLAALPVPVQAVIILEEAVKHFDGNLAVTTMPQIGGGTDQTYVLVISTESNSDVTNVRDTLDELSWVERKQQCTVSNGESGIRLWTAQGSPSGPFQVEITHAVAGMDLTAVLARYSGVLSFEDATGENTNGENDVTCSGTTKTTTAQLTLTSTSNQSVHVIGVCPKQSFITSYSPGYALIDGQQTGRAYTFVYDRTVATAATDQFQATVNGASIKWGTAGIVLSPSGPATVNYRSIGVTTGDLASGNDASINATESTIVLGGSETFPANIGQGDKLTISSPVGSYSDDFTDGVITGWTDMWTDSLSESSGALRSTASSIDAHYTVDEGSGWTDYTVTCDIMAEDDDDAGITFRVQDGSNYYRFWQRFGNSGPTSWDLWLERVVGGTPTDLATPFDNEGAAAGQVDSEGVWYTFKVEVSGTSIKCYIDDVLKFDVVDPVFSDGTVGVWCESQEGRWDNMLVSGIGGGDTVFHVLTRDSDTQVTVQETAAVTLSNDAWAIERAYNHFWTWKGDRNGDLVAQNRREVGVCYNDGPFVPEPFAFPVQFWNSTTDANHYMKVTVAEGHRHNGTAGTGARVTGVVDDVFQIQNQYTVIEWLEIESFSGAGVDGIVVGAGGTGAVLQNLLIYDFTAADTGIQVTEPATVRNCILHDGSNGIVVTGGSGDATVESTTIYNMFTDGVEVAVGNSLTMRNCIAVGSLVDVDLSGTIDYFGYNMYDPLAWAGQDPETFDGNNQTPPVFLGDLFLSLVSPENLHLKASGHTAGNTGLDLSAAFTDDIDDEVRTGSWDIGADEAIPGGGSARPKILSWREVEPN